MTPEKLIVFLLTLSVLVILHEYGHFLLARRNGVRVTDFALGMGPTLLKWTSKRSGTNYRLNLLPIGGYCQMRGEDGKSNEAEQQRAFRGGHEYDADNFQAKTPLQRLSIVLAGPIMNFIVALVLLIGGAIAFGIPGAAPSTQIFQLLPGQPADRAGLRSGDRIVAVNGRAMTDGNVLVDTIHHSTGKLLHVEYVRDGVTRAVDVTPVRAKSPDGTMEGHLGFTPATLPHRVAPPEAVSYAVSYFTFVVKSTLGSLGALVTHPSTVIGQVQGPIGMARVSAQAQDFGPFVFITLAAMISISLGVFNLLPIPALDGGRGVFILVEMLRGKPVDPEKEALVHVGGFAVLIALMLAVSYHDVSAALAGHAAF
ncbi:RIP metalloprotease RseP [Vulcanimicrobium alpinum]|uniref:RIP metalloprotease RseP n=1 Tax=Vulcanimicrobium alpinum TaxID=3016050 RepID=A0AAN1XXW8_UNVUL|nr:M50 family metallopeptidase [Vulcanimicrobium alpinum]BDE06277.1 RIP metalloprotease RseP [Vulcanimicrobium alpinum]